MRIRIPIREQLAALILLSSLIGLGVISIATWVRISPLDSSVALDITDHLPDHES